MPKARIDPTIKFLNEQGDAVLIFIADKIKEARKQAGLSQRQLSTKVGKSHSFIARVEARNTEPGILELLAIALATNKPPLWFLPNYFRNKDATDAEKKIAEWEEQIRRLKETAEEIKI